MACATRRYAINLLFLCVCLDADLFHVFIQYDGPITDVTDPSVICNGGPNPLVTPYSQTIITVPAGGTFTAEWHHVLQPNGYNSGDNADPIDPGVCSTLRIPDARFSDPSMPS